MRARFDHLAKRLGREALGPSGVTVVHDEIFPETLHADLRHEPDPARKIERERLGLLGRFAAVLCLIEIYGHAPSADELRACLLCRARHNRHYADCPVMPRSAGAFDEDGGWRRGIIRALQEGEQDAMAVVVAEPRPATWS